MWSRATSDYTPTRPGSRAENAAINARREMINLIASTPPRRHKPNKLEGPRSRRVRYS